MCKTLRFIIIGLAASRVSSLRYVVSSDEEIRNAVSTLSDYDTIEISNDIKLTGHVQFKSVANVTLTSSFGNKFTIDGDGKDRCFSLLDAGLTITNLMVMNCSRTVDAFGGAFYLQGSMVNAIDVDVVSNYAHEGGGWYVWDSTLNYMGGQVINNTDRAIEDGPCH